MPKGRNLHASYIYKNVNDNNNNNTEKKNEKNVRIYVKNIRHGHFCPHPVFVKKNKYAL